MPFSQIMDIFGLTNFSFNCQQKFLIISFLVLIISDFG